MSNTVGDIIDILSKYPKEHELIDYEGNNFIHVVNTNKGDKPVVILSTVKPIGHCADCGDYVYPTTVRDYEGACPSCDVNYYQFEIEPLEKEEE